MNLLYTAVGGFHTLESQACLRVWREEFHLIEEMPLERLHSYLRFDLGSARALVDAIICMADMDSILWASGMRVRGLTNALPTAVAVAKDVRNLPETCTMSDGRKWRSIPFVIFCDSHHTTLAIPDNVQILTHGFDPFTASDPADCRRIPRARACRL